MSSQQRMVLHIDDDEEDRMILEEALKNLDSNVIVRQAASGHAALSFLHQSKHFNDLPCLIVLDMNLPGMNGVDILREIKMDAELAVLPLVIFTTASPKAYTDLLAKENIELISKPTSPAELVSSVKKILSFCPPRQS